MTGKRNMFVLSILITLTFGSQFIFAQNSFEGKINIGADLFEAHKYEEAKIHFENMREVYPDSAEIYHFLFKIYTGTELFDDAHIYALKAVELSPDKAIYYVRLGQSYSNQRYISETYRRPHDVSNIEKSYKKALQIDPQNERARINLFWYYYNIPSFKGGDYKKALAQCDTLLTINEFEGVRLKIAALSALERYDEAHILVERLEAIKSIEYHEFLINNIHGYLLLSQERYDEAIEKFIKLVEIAPDEPNSYDSLGEGYWKKGDLQLALECYKKAHELAPHINSIKAKIADIEAEL